MTGAVPAGELLGCPLCGGVAHLDIGKNHFEDAEVSCHGCGCQGPNHDDGYGREDNARLAITAWNTRVPATPSPQPVAEVEAREVLMDKRMIAEAVAKAIDPNRNLALNPLYYGDPAWRIAHGVQDAILSALGGRA